MRKSSLVILFGFSLGVLYTNCTPNQFSLKEQALLTGQQQTEQQTEQPFPSNPPIEDTGVSIHVSWQMPSDNTDGTALTDLTGFKIYYGVTSGDYTKNIDVGYVSSFEIKGLPSDIYYFSVTAYGASGNESEYSEEVSADIRDVAM